MGTPKSQAEVFYLDLLCQLVLSDPLSTTQPKSLAKDLETLRSRARNEGMSFLTKTLPLLGRALDAGLAQTRFVAPREFKRSRKNPSIPAFMQAYFNLVFDCDGNLLDGAAPGAVSHLRQVLFFMYKLESPYDKVDEDRVIDSFVAVERELEVGGFEASDALLAAASFVARDVFQEFNPKDIIPRHGPGAVATGEKLEDKWEFSRLYSSIHQVYPYYEYFVVGGSRELVDRLAWYKSLERLSEGRAKVILVPKDSRGPRLISCEPLEFQWVQQGLGRKMVGHLETFPATRGQINFTNQEVNRQLALVNSMTREYATVDLKDASDRVSVALVREVFRHTPELLRCLLATRTTATTLPDGRVVRLSKFAPMGSALCFPVEAFCFWAICVAAISRETALPLRKSGKLVYVYGDDIIVPTDKVELCMQALESVGLRVNRHKTCIHGPFRESCGMDAFMGVQVTPTRVRKPWSGRKSDGTAFAAYVSLANELSRKGYAGAADMIWGQLRTVYGKIPYGTANSSYPCIILSNPFEAELRNVVEGFRWRWSSHLQRIEFQLLRLKSKKLQSKLDGWTRLLRNSVFPGNEQPTTVVIPRSTQIKRGWASV